MLCGNHMPSCGFWRTPPCRPSCEPCFPRTFTLSFKVVDACSRWPLAFATFELCRGCASVAVCTTDFSGCVRFDGLSPGTYRLREALPAPGYCANDCVFFVRITPEGAIFINGSPMNCFVFGSRGCSCF